MKRKLALPVFLLAAVLCAVWSFIEAKQPTPASLREQLIDALDSADAVYFEPDSLESNQPEGPVTDAKYVEEICALLRQIEPADDVAWPAEEERPILSNASFMLLTGHDAEDLTTADCVTKTPRYHILTDRSNDRTLIFVHSGVRSYGNEDFRLIGALPFTGLDYTIAMDQKLQSRTGSELLTLTEKVGGQTVTLRVYELNEDGYARYALFHADGTEIDIPFGVDRRTWIGEDKAAKKVSLTARDDVLGFPGFELETIQGGRMTVRYFYALTEQGFVYAGEAFGHGFDDTEWSDGVWMLDLTGDGRSELVTRSTFGDGVPYVFVYRWNAAEGISQHSGIIWEKANAQLAKLSAPLGSVARAETYHAEDNTVTLTLYTENGTKETTLPLTTDILGEWFTNI